MLIKEQSLKNINLTVEEGRFVAIEARGRLVQEVYLMNIRVLDRRLL